MNEDVAATDFFEEDQLGTVVEERDKSREGGGCSSQPKNQSERIVFDYR